MIRAFPLNPSIARKLLALSFCSILTLEGLAWISGASTLQGTNASWVRALSAYYGPLNIFCAALIATDWSAIHRRNLIYQLATALKALYLSFNSSTSVALLARRNQSYGHQRPWLVVRLVITLLWIVISLDDFVCRRHQSTAYLPGLRGGDDSSTSGSSASLSDSEYDVG